MVLKIAVLAPMPRASSAYRIIRSRQCARFRDEEKDSRCRHIGSTSSSRRIIG